MLQIFKEINQLHPVFLILDGMKMQAKCGGNKILKDVEERLALRQKWPMVGIWRASSALHSCCVTGRGLRASPRMREPDWQHLHGQGAFRALGSGGSESSVWALLKAAPFLSFSWGSESSVWALLEAAPFLSFSWFCSVFLFVLHLFTPYPLFFHWMEVSVLWTPGSWRASLPLNSCHCLSFLDHWQVTPPGRSPREDGPH